MILAFLPTTASIRDDRYPRIGITLLLLHPRLCHPTSKNWHPHPKRYSTYQSSIMTIREPEIYFLEPTRCSPNSPLPSVYRNVLPQPITRESAVEYLETRMEGLCVLLFVSGLLCPILMRYIGWSVYSVACAALSSLFS